jgi:hypothetical protein
VYVCARERLQVHRHRFLHVIKYTKPILLNVNLYIRLYPQVKFINHSVEELASRKAHWRQVNFPLLPLERNDLYENISHFCVCARIMSLFAHHALFLGRLSRMQAGWRRVWAVCGVTTTMKRTPILPPATMASIDGRRGKRRRRRRRRRRERERERSFIDNQEMTEGRQAQRPVG